MNSVSPSLTCWPILTKDGLPGSGASIDRADHGRGDGAGLRTGGWRRTRQRAPRQRGAAAGWRCNRGHRAGAGDPDARAIMLDLDFGEAGFRQKIGQLADRVGVDARLVAGQCDFKSVFSFISLSLGRVQQMPAMASIASR